METLIACIITIVLTGVFGVLVCKSATKSALKSQYDKPVPGNLQPATEEEKDLLRYNYELVGTISGGKYIQKLLEEWCQSLYVAYGTIVDAHDDTFVGDGITNTTRKAKVQIDDLQFEVELDNAIVNDEVIIFYSKDNNGHMTYRYTIIKK